MHSDRFSLKATLANPEFEHKIKDCKGVPVFAGPLWLGNLYDKKFLAKTKIALESLHADLHKKLPAKLSTMIDESDVQDYMYTDLHALCDLHGLSPPKSTSVIERLVNDGYKAVRTSFRPTAIRTDAPVNEIVTEIEKILGEEE
jgi:tRNA (guanine26-N2/guanine27-N2)-dimethyltransferase